MQRYYFDHNATTPLAPEVLDAMRPALTEDYGNAASLHHFGQVARKRLDAARREVAACLGAEPPEILFTSGGTEADQLAILGRHHVVTTTVEHPAVLTAARQNDSATFIEVDSRGVVDPDDIRKALTPGTSLISVMHANNELGTIQPIEAIARIAREAGVEFHSDGVQAAGKIPVNVRELGVDLYSIAAHKIYGPKGVGVLFNRGRGRRAGTENVAGALGIAAALWWQEQHGAGERARKSRPCAIVWNSRCSTVFPASILMERVRRGSAIHPTSASTGSTPSRCSSHWTCEVSPSPAVRRAPVGQASRRMYCKPSG